MRAQLISFTQTGFQFQNLNSQVDLRMCRRRGNESRGVRCSKHILPICSSGGHKNGVRHYVNLTNGIEVLPALSKVAPSSEIRFMRLQSSHAEASAYDKILSELDHDLLWSLASGFTCYMYDFASRNPKRGVPRSQFLGCEFVKWALAYLWFGRDSPLLPAIVNVRGKNVARFWRDEVLPYQIRKETKRRIRYFSPFSSANGVTRIDLRAVYGRVSVIDGRKEAHVELAREWVTTGRACSNASDMSRIEEWMEGQRLAEFHANTDQDELRAVQRWMVEGRELWDETKSAKGTKQ